MNINLIYYEGQNINNYYVTDYNNDFNLLLKKLWKIFVLEKYKDYKVYFHNFSKFDGIFMLPALSSIGNVNPIIQKGKLITLKFNLFNNSKYQITFRDSYLLLPSSLRKLCKSFNVNTSKTIFPFKLTDLWYSGPVPSFLLFNNLSLEEYNNYKNNFIDLWNFKEESIKYCNIDCIALYEIISIFNNLIFNKFK